MFEMNWKKKSGNKPLLPDFLLKGYLPFVLRLRLACGALLWGRLFLLSGAKGLNGFFPFIFGLWLFWRKGSQRLGADGSVALKQHFFVAA